MAPRRTLFNIKWKDIYPWINSVPDEEYKAYCKHCKKVFSVAGKGEGCVKEHADTAKHKEAERAVAISHSMQHFFNSKLRLCYTLHSII